MADSKTPATLEAIGEMPFQPVQSSGPSHSQTSTSAPAINENFTIPEPQENIEPDNDSGDDYDDADSTFGGSIGAGSDTTSIATSVLNYRYENGRRYHAYHEGQYIMPNDEREQDRMDLAHHVFKLVLGGALSRAPIGSQPQRVLDFGTGTGIWAIEFADEFPSATVIGCDLSPIQPSWVPPNCRFQVDDAESTWQYTQPFDYIHGRAMAGSIGNWDRLLRQAYDNLCPGGWLELQEFDVWIYADDGTLANAPFCCQWQQKLDEASTKFGKKMNIAYRYKSQMEATGFIEVVDDVYKVPFSPWPKERRLKEISRYQQLAMLEAVEPYTLALFTRVLGWSMDEVQVLIANVKNELKDRSVHMYGKMHFVYGRKPKN